MSPTPAIAASEEERNPKITRVAILSPSLTCCAMSRRWRRRTLSVAVESPAAAAVWSEMTVLATPLVWAFSQSSALRSAAGSCVRISPGLLHERRADVRADADERGDDDEDDRRRTERGAGCGSAPATPPRATRRVRRARRGR